MNPAPNREVALFSAALELPASQRAAYLDEACADDPALRLRLEALLRDHEAAGAFLETPPPGAQEPPLGAEGPGATVRLSGSPAERAGDRIGRYKLLQQIGEGGCGVVYMAEQEQPVRRRVALKVIKLGMDTKQVVARFEAERQALALMDHPNIAKVLDAGATDAGRPFFVMELVRGIKITDFCDENHLSTEQRLRLFVQVCQAIQHAHQKGIIHRDIKPSNVLVADHDGVPVPKIIDFGIAKATTDQRLTDKTLFTAFEQFMGTPAYMSPEQARLSGLDIDTRSDIYSLGVLLYELLTGQTPFEAKRLLDIGLDEIRRIIREEEPERPSTRLSTLTAADLTQVAEQRHAEPAKLSGLIRGDLDWIVMKALEKDRARRYETANGLAMDIERHLNCEPVVARPPSRLYEFQRTVRRHKVGFAAAAALMTVLAVGALVSTLEALRATRAVREQSRLREAAQQAQANEARLRQQAEADQKKAETEAAKSLQVAQFLKDMLQGVGPSVALGRDTTLLREIMDKTAQRITQDLKAQPEVQIELSSTLADTYHELAQYKAMEEMARDALRVARSSHGEESLAVADALGQLGDALMHLGVQDEAESATRQAIALERKSRGRESLREADALYNLASVLRNEGKLTEAETAAREALAMRKKLLGAEHLEVARSLDCLSYVLRGEQRLTEAETAAREALAMRKKLLVGEHPDFARSFSAIGDVLADQGKVAEAETFMRQAIATQSKLRGESRLLSSSYMALARLLRQANRNEESAELARKAIAALDRALADFPAERQQALLTQAHNYRYLGGYLESLRDLPGARAAFTASSRFFTECAEKAAVGMKATCLDGRADNFRHLGELWDAEARSAEAHEAYRQALTLHELIEREGLAPHVALGWAGDHYKQMGQLVEKIGTPEDALRVSRLLRPPEAASRPADLQGLAVCRLRLGNLLRKNGKTEEAREQFAAAEQAVSVLTKSLEGQPTASADLSRARRREVALACLELAKGASDAAQHGTAEQAARQAIGLSKQLAQDDPKRSDYPIDLGHSQWQLANVLAKTGRREQAEPILREAVQVFEQAAHDFPAELYLRQEQAYSRRLIGDVLNELGRVDEAEREQRAAIALYAGLKAAAPANAFYRQEEAYTTWMMAGMLEGAGRLDAAEAEYRQAIALHEKASAEFPNEAVFTERLGTVKVRLVELLCRRGKLAEAKSMYREAAQRGSASDLNALAWSLATSGDPNLRDGTNAVVFAEKAVAATNRRNGSYLDTLAAAYAETGQFAKAISVQQEAIALSQSEPEKKDLASRLKLYENKAPYRDQGSLAELTSARLREGKFADAEGLARECLAIREREIPDDWRTFNARSMLGGSLLGQKKYAEAEPLLLAGYEGMKQREVSIPPEGKVRLSESLQRLVQLYQATQRPDQAAEWKQKLAALDNTQK